MMEQFEPMIVAFCCQYCAYTAADTAGSEKLSYPPNLRIVRVPCTGKVDTMHLMRAFQKGADGVWVVSCLEGDCHFKDGNVKADHRVAHVRKLLKEIGVGEDRLEIVSFSAGMGDRFAQSATDFTERIRQLGPNPVQGGSQAAA